MIESLRCLQIDRNRPEHTARIKTGNKGRMMARASILAGDSDIRRLHSELVGKNIVSEDVFWTIHQVEQLHELTFFWHWQVVVLVLQ